MTEQEFNNLNARGLIKPIEPPPPIIPPTTPAPKPENPVEMYQMVLQAILRPKRHITVAPTFIPKHFADQIQFYDDGVTRKVYFYVNNTWRYVTLT